MKSLRDIEAEPLVEMRTDAAPRGIADGSVRLFSTVLPLQRPPQSGGATAASVAHPQRGPGAVVNLVEVAPSGAC